MTRRGTIRALEPTVNAVNGAPTANADIAYGRAGHTVVASVLGNDRDPESGIDPWSVRILSPAALGAAAANIPAPGVVSYEATAAGVDVIVYEMCDRLGNCDTAGVVIQVLSRASRVTS